MKKTLTRKDFRDWLGTRETHITVEPMYGIIVWTKPFGSFRIN